MHSDLALADQAVLAQVHELDRILDGEYMALFAVVDVIDHGRESGGLARAGFARDQYQAAVDLAQIHDGFRQFQLRRRARRGWNRAEHRPHAVQLAHHVDAETGYTRHAVGEIGAVFGFESLHRQFRHDFVQRRLDRVGRKRLGTQSFQLAVLPDSGRIARHEVQVRPVALQDLVQIGVDGWHEVL